MAHAWCSATAAGGVQGVQEAKQAIVRARGTRLARARACAPAAARERCAHSPVAASCGAARAAEPAASSLRAAGAARGSREVALSRASASPSVSSARRGGGLGALRTRQRRQRLRQGLFAIQARRARGAAAARPVSALFAAPSVRAEPSGVSRDVGAAAAAAARQARRCRHRTATAAAGRRSRYAPRGGTRVRASSLVASHAACWDVLSTPWQRLGPTLGLISSLVRQIYLCNRSVMPSARDPSPESCARLPRRRSHASVCARSARLCARL